MVSLKNFRYLELITYLLLAIYLTEISAEISYRPIYKIGDGLMGLSNGTLQNLDNFGTSVAVVGDLNNDTLPDIAVGAIGDSTSGIRRGAVYILMMNSNPQVINVTKISDGLGGLPNGTLQNNEHFGSCLTSVNDFDGNGFPDLIVGASDNNNLGPSRGVIYLLMLGAFGQVDNFLRIGDGEGGFPSGILMDLDQFGLSCSSLGDLDLNGYPDIVVGANGENHKGQIFILFLNSSGLVNDYLQISEGIQGLPSGLISENDRFGFSLSVTDDLNSDNNPELFIGARGQEEAYLAYLHSNGTFKSIVSLTENIDPDLLSSANFLGTSNSWLPGLKTGSEVHLVVGAVDNTGGNNRGGLYFLTISSDISSVKVLKVVDGQGGIPSDTLNDNDFFGRAVTSYQSSTLIGISPSEPSGTTTLFIGAPGDSSNQGALYVAEVSNSGSGSENEDPTLIIALSTTLPCLFIIGCPCLIVLIVIGSLIIRKRQKRKISTDLEDGQSTGSELDKVGGMETGISLKSTSSSVKLNWGKKNWQIENDDLQLEQPPIASGSFGVVYKGKYHGTVVAVKTLIGEDQLTTEDFAHEVELLSRLHHPNIVLYMGATASPRSMITEYVSRGSLYDVLKNSAGEITPKRIVKIALGIAKGMAYLHGNKPPVIHRDLKSQNILITKNFQPKIADFGISRTVTRQESMTQRAGTTRWTAPEVLDGGDYTEKADVYSYAIILWELLDKQGQMPFNHEKWDFQVEKRVLRGERPEIPEGNHPEAILQVMKRCWDENPKNRPTFPEIVEILES